MHLYYYRSVLHSVHSWLFYAMCCHLYREYRDTRNETHSCRIQIINPASINIATGKLTQLQTKSKMYNLLSLRLNIPSSFTSNCSLARHLSFRKLNSPKIRREWMGNAEVQRNRLTRHTESDRGQTTGAFRYIFSF